MMTPQPEPGAGAAIGWILAIDTSTERAGLAIGDETRTLARSWEAGRAQTTSVLPAIDELLDEAGIAPSQLGAVAIATGPGTFTGLRVGMSIAKGLVLALDIPLLAVPTLEVAAATADSRECIAVLPAGRGRIVWQRFGVKTKDPPRNTTVPEFVAFLEDEPGILVTGDLAESQREVVEQSHPHVDWTHRSPERLLELARARWNRGDIADPVSLEPMYVHGVTVSAGPIQDRLKRQKNGS